MKRVLVAGAGGFIGNHQDAWLLSLGQSRCPAAIRRPTPIGRHSRRRHRFRVELAPARALQHSLPCDLPIMDLPAIGCRRIRYDHQ